jgi:hypothetical protein
MCLSFTIAAGPRRRSHSRVRVPWDSQPYFTASDSRLFVASFDSQGYGGGIRSLLIKVKIKVMLRPTVSRPICLDLGLTTRFLLLSDCCVFVDVGRSVWRENGSPVYNCCWSSPAQSFLGLSPAGLMTIFYCLGFETPPTWRTRSPLPLVRCCIT